MPILRKPATTTTPGRTTTPQQKVPAPTPGTKQAPQGDSFAERYQKTDAAAGGTFVPPVPGTYNALITEAVAARDADGINEVVYLELTIADDENEMRDKTCRIYYNFTGENGEQKTGYPFFKSDMVQLGFAEDFKSWDEMAESIATLAAENVWVIIDVKKKGKWTNIFLSSVPENQNEKPSLD